MLGYYFVSSQRNMGNSYLDSQNSAMIRGRRCRTHNLVVVGSSPTRLTLGLSRLPTDNVIGLGDDYILSEF